MTPSDRRNDKPRSSATRSDATRSSATRSDATRSNATRSRAAAAAAGSAGTGRASRGNRRGGSGGSGGGSPGRGPAIRRAPAPAVWLMHHRAALTGTLARFRADRLGTLLVALTLGIALALPMLLWVLVSELADLTADWDDRPRINLFVGSELAAPDVETLLTRLRENPEIAAVSWQSPEASLAEFAAGAGFGTTLGAGVEALGGNPLPGVALVTPTEAVLAPARLRGLAARLETEPGVEGVQLDLDWVLRLQATLALVGRLGWGLAGLLAIGVLLIVGSLTRMALEQRREEIVVLRLVGGTDAFVRRPFLYLGTLQGVAGGIAAWLLVTIAVALLAGPVLELARSYGSAFRLELPLLASAGVLLGSGALLGWIGARIAVGRQLAAIEP